MAKITCKFGGTSLADAASLKQAAEIVRANPDRRFVVASAPGKRDGNDRKVTDLLYAWHSIASQGLDAHEPQGIIADRFREMARGLGVAFDIDAHLAEIVAEARSQPTADYLASRGEYLNSRLLAEYLGAQFVDPAEYIKFTDAGDLDPITYDLLGKALAGPGLFVVPGFYGSLPNGDIKTFSRGGSDITGAIVARASQSDLYENWTDVSGFLMTDPRIVPGAKGISEITYQELRELSYMGATVLHDEAIFPVREPGIPINIRNTKDPEHPGTRIVPTRVSTSPVCGVAGRAGFSMLSIEKPSMNKERGFGLKVLSVLEEFGVGWEHMPTGIDTLSIIIRDDELKNLGAKLVETLVKRLETKEVALAGGIAMIATVGHGMNHHVGIAARLCTAIAKANVNLRVIDQGSSEMNIIVGVDEADLAAAVRAIYEEFAN